MTHLKKKLFTKCVSETKLQHMLHPRTFLI